MDEEKSLLEFIIGTSRSPYYLEAEVLFLENIQASENLSLLHVKSVLYLTDIRNCAEEVPDSAQFCFKPCAIIYMQVMSHLAF